MIAQKCDNINNSIIDETRRSIIDAILAIGNISGDKEYHEFVKIVYPAISEENIHEIARHMDRFDDWPESFLLNTIIDYMKLTDDEFIFFLEQYVNPNIHHWKWNKEEECRDYINNSELVEMINSYLDHDGYKLVIKDTIGDKNFYECISTKPGVEGKVKNIIFAAKYKPEIVFDDALNNDIRITRNENQCLIFDQPIPSTGLTWDRLVEWYSEKNDIKEKKEKEFLIRLCDCLDTSIKQSGGKTGPETIMMQAYYELKKELGRDLPALIPQVYLYYDPLTLKERGYKFFEHQKMDYLMIFSHRDRIVIEIDGKQHYADGDKASPKLYSEMVEAQREMSLLGYDVYRFGGYEFYMADKDDTIKQAVLDKIKQFFMRLFKKYGIL